MNFRRIKRRFRNFFAERLNEFSEIIVWQLTAMLYGLMVIAVFTAFYAVLPNSWQDSVKGVVEEFSNFMGSVFTAERLTKIENGIQRVMASMFIGLLVFYVVLIACVGIFSVLLAVAKVERGRWLARVAVISIFGVSICVTYVIVLSQPVAEMVDKAARFLAH